MFRAILRKSATVRQSTKLMLNQWVYCDNRGIMKSKEAKMS